MYDIYDNGTPKYSTAIEIYDSLQNLVDTEEIGILQDIFADVSYEGQEYYYTDKGALLIERFDKLADYGNKMWIFDLAIFQMDDNEVHSIVYDSLLNQEMARRVGLKKLFIKYLLKDSYEDKYEKVRDDFAYELGELDGFYDYDIMRLYNKVAHENGIEFYGVFPYQNFCYFFKEKVEGLRLSKEVELIAECRALLTSYDDFMMGLKMNQHLYTTLEQQFNVKKAKLQDNFSRMAAGLLSLASAHGLGDDFQAELKWIHDHYTHEQDQIDCRLDNNVFEGTLVVKTEDTQLGVISNDDTV